MPTVSFDEDRPALCIRRLLVRGSGFVVADMHCQIARSGWGEAHETSSYVLAFTRSGCFERRANGTETLLDAAVAFFSAPGEEHQVAHPDDRGDRSTMIDLEPSLLAALWGGDPGGLPGALFSTPALDLAQRRLLARCLAGAPGAEVEELVNNVAAAALRQHDPARVESGYPASAALRRRIVRDARQMLAHDPSATLGELARELAVSPHHLSRIFSAATGASVTTYRKRLRARAALELIADGERSLTRVAAKLGFTDHAHLTRTIRSETGLTPSAHRKIWKTATAD